MPRPTVAVNREKFSSLGNVPAATIAAIESEDRHWLTTTPPWREQSRIGVGTEDFRERRANGRQTL
jgi:hypothetical protein